MKTNCNGITSAAIVSLPQESDASGTMGRVSPDMLEDVREVGGYYRLGGDKPTAYFSVQDRRGHTWIGSIARLGRGARDGAIALGRQGDPTQHIFVDTRTGLASMHGVDADEAAALIEKVRAEGPKEISEKDAGPTIGDLANALTKCQQDLIKKLALLAQKDVVELALEFSDDIQSLLKQPQPQEAPAASSAQGA